MKEQKMSIEQVRAMIKRMHAELEEVEKVLTMEETAERWTFPDDNYTILAIWLLYDPHARRLFPVNEKKSWAELADRLTNYVGWAVEWHSLRRNYTRKNIKKAK